MLKYLLKTIRPKQWAKNGLLFAALIFDQQLANVATLLTALAGFALFCLLSSTIYIINDLLDIEADRQHPTKHNRPLASGNLPKSIAIGALILFLITTLPLAYLINPSFFIIGLIYLGTNLAYSSWFKHVPLLDVLLLAGFYVIRVGAGVTLIDVERFSPWLYLFTTFLALFLGIGKRRSELSLMAGDTYQTRRVLEGYSLPFLDQLLIIVSSMTIITYSLYTFFAPNLPENNFMMLTIPFLIYGIFRYLHLVQVEKIGEAPEEVLFSDHPLQATIIFFWNYDFAYFLYYLDLYPMPAFTASAPGKIILFGEHAVVYGRPAIAVPVSQARVKAIVTPDIGGKSGSGRIQAPCVNLDASLADLSSDHPLVTVLESVFSTLDVKHIPAFTLRNHVNDSGCGWVGVWRSRFCRCHSGDGCLFRATFTG